MGLTINEEVIVLCLRIIKKCDSKFDIHELHDPLCTLAEKHCIDPDFLATVGSWGDTLEDQEVAELLESYNQTGQIFSQIWASAESPKGL